jgi:hypothetical protein
MTILASNSAAGAGPNVAGTFISRGHNLIGDASGSSIFLSEGDLIGIDAKLGPLQNNGGPTWTHALMPTSPAINAGTLMGAPPTDQRGILRPQGAAVDIGAYEYVPPTLTLTRINGLTLDAPTGLTYRIEFRESFLPSTPWSAWTNVTLTKTPLSLGLPQLTNKSGFFRAVSESN